MLEHFAVDESETIVVHPSALLESVAALFVANGSGRKDAEIAAGVLVDADVRGVDTHGVSNMLRRYLGLIDEGFVNPRPNWKIVRETPSTATVDCDQGLASSCCRSSWISQQRRLQKPVRRRYWLVTEGTPECSLTTPCERSGTT